MQTIHVLVFLIATSVMIVFVRMMSFDAPSQHVGFQKTNLNRRDGYKFVMYLDGQIATFLNAFELLHRGDRHMVSALEYALTSDFEAVFWECISIAPSEFRTKPFEFVVLPAPSLAGREVDIEPFANKFTLDDGSCAVSFTNLGGDSMLVVPCPNSGGEMTHLASFLRSAPHPYRLALWKRLAHEVLQLMNGGGQGGEAYKGSPGASSSILTGNRSIGTTEGDTGNLSTKRWISTSGLGVSWLHIRVDSIPKYYNYLPYKKD